MATPLHFAVMYREYKNVELIIKFGIDVDAQDVQGHTAIHICIIRLVQDPEAFDDYKRVIKELLFRGASRDIKTKKGQTALEMLE